MRFLILMLAFCGFFDGVDIKETSIEVPFFFVESNKEDLSWQNGTLELNGKPFSGYLTEYYEDRSLRSQTPYVEGKRNGNEYLYYQNGQLNEQRIYRAGYKIGIHQGWWEKGQSRFVYQFDDYGNYHGNCKEWFRDGNLFRDFNYINGQESGQQKMYNADGTVRANYIIKKNRKYGLQGRKKCIPASDPGF